MAITIEWLSKIILVPRSDMTLVQSTPVEIRELNLNNFRLALKDIEDSVEGIVNLDTHRHNTEVSLGGLTFARTVEIINGYTVTFEDGQYAVNLVGANSNVGDVSNVNQVSVRSQNSAGLISTPLIEFSSFEGGVWVDTATENSGTIHPVGTRLAPVNNLSDAKLIADYRGFNTIYVVGDLVLDADIDFFEFIFRGQARVNNTIEVATITGCVNSVFEDLTVTGTLDGGNELKGCILKDVTYVNGYVHDCGLIGAINLNGDADAIFANCYTLDPYNPPILDVGGAGQDVIMPNYAGLLTLKNHQSTHFIGIGLNAGEVILEDSIASGTVHVSGSGVVKDSLGNFIETGMWNTNVMVINEAVSNSGLSTSIARSVWAADVNQHLIVNSFGEMMNKIKTWVNYLRGK